MVTASELSGVQRALVEVGPRLEALGVTEDKIRHFTTTEDGRAKMAAFFNAALPNAQNNSGSGASETTYPVTVRKDRTLVQMIEAGKYDWVNSDITPERFPDIGPDGEYELVLVHFNRVVSTEAAIAEMLKCGLTPAFIGMLLAFGEKYPEIQRQFPIVALSSVCVHSVGPRYSPYLSQDGRKRDLSLSWLDIDWSEGCRFLAFRKVK